MPNQLRTLLTQPGIHAAPAVYDCLGALLAARAGFPFVFTSGFGLSAALLGKPDMGYLTATEMIDAAARIAAAVEIPVIADLDTGYGNPLNVVHTVEQVARTRVAGLLLEDQEWPKKCGHFEDKRVISAAEHVEKIKAAVYARGSDGPIIIARTDARAVEGLDGALRRGEAYLAAGADVLFVEAPQSREELATIAAHFRGVPLMANLIEGGKTPNLTVAELDALGYKLVAYALSGLFAVTEALQTCFAALYATGATASVPHAVTFPEFKELIDIDRHRALEQRFRHEPGAGGQ